jgi:hypothetical protein
MKSMMKPVLSLIVVSAITVASAHLFAEPGKCSPCQERRSIQEAIAQSIKDAAAAALAAGGAYTREQELDMASDMCSKCGCSRTNQDIFAQDIEKCGCGKPKTRSDSVTQAIEKSEVLTVAACCEFCAQPGSLGCQGRNAYRCNTCQQGLIKMSIAEAVDAALAVAQALAENELDQIPDVSRAPREELVDPCNPCGPDPVCEINACGLNAQLRALRCCCESLSYQVGRQGSQAKKCCKKLRHKIEDVEDLVETVIDQSASCCSLTETLLVSVIDQSAACCSATDTVLGDPLASSVLDIPLCSFISIADGVINATDADIMTWLKTIYSLLYRVHGCVCCGG